MRPQVFDRRSSLAATLLIVGIACAGCGSSQDHSDDHEVEHTRPDHWPTTFVDLVNDIESRWANRSNASETASTELNDLLKWLPEIAADTTLNEADWTAAVAAGSELEAALGSDAAPQSAFETLQALAQKTADDPEPFVPGRPRTSRESDSDNQPSGTSEDRVPKSGPNSTPSDAAESSTPSEQETSE